MLTVYVETSVVSYAVARPSTLPHHLVRHDDAERWWTEFAPRYRLYISQVVIDEAAAGDAAAAKQRLALLTGVPLIPLTHQVHSIAAELLRRSVLPPGAAVDALHVAAAAVGGVDYLLTLNCRHIANAHTLPRVYRTLEDLGLPRPLVCTPEEFFDDDF
jgi:predicted nucleic acid-binding protein